MDYPTLWYTYRPTGSTAGQVKSGQVKSIYGGSGATHSPLWMCPIFSPPLYDPGSHDPDMMGWYDRIPPVLNSSQVVGLPVRAALRYTQVKSSQVVGLRDRVAITSIRGPLSSPPPVGKAARGIAVGGTVFLYFRPLLDSTHRQEQINRFVVSDSVDLIFLLFMPYFPHFLQNVWM